MYVDLSSCSWLQEIETIKLACEEKINHLRIINFTKSKENINVKSVDSQSSWIYIRYEAYPFNPILIKKRYKTINFLIINFLSVILHSLIFNLTKFELYYFKMKLNE
jgi:hypothetical protein